MRTMRRRRTRLSTRSEEERVRNMEREVMKERR